MAIEPKEALGMLGYDPDTFETTDDFVAAVEKDWVKMDQAHLNKEIQGKVFGKVNNALRTKIKQSGKALEIDGDWESMDPTEGIEMLTRAAGEKLKELRAAQAEAGKGKSSKEVEELTRQYTELQTKYKGTEDLYKQAITKYDELDNAVKSEKHQAKVDAIYTTAEQAIKFKDGISKFELDGFRSFMRKTFPVKFDDEGREYVTDANGERIKDKTKAAAFVDLPSLFKEYAEKEKLTGGAPQGGAPVRRVLLTGAPAQAPTATPQVGARPTRAVMPR